MPRRVKQSDIKPSVTRLLWGRAGARCEFAGCNKPLWKSDVTQESVALAERAHIYAASDYGPRGNAGVPTYSLNDFDNLILVCPDCHKVIDKEADGGRYTAEVLRGWKAAHESRIEQVTGITPDMGSHVVHYGAPVGELAKPLNFKMTAPALFPERYPASDRPISLEMVNTVWRDQEDGFWHIEEENLCRQFDEKLAPLITSGAVDHLSVFGFAPQPLLVKLGALITDIQESTVFQLRREPAGWGWDHNADPIRIELIRPETTEGDPALVFSISATITPERVHKVTSDDTAIWEVRAETPHNDLVRSPGHLRAFRELVRPVLDEIKKHHGQTTPVHVFPAMPVAFATELGRIRMPKADSPWVIYDQNNKRGGFVEAVRLG
ncbi:MAG: SAVED domain-containing protein [Phycisphaerales bacterium]